MSKSNPVWKQLLHCLLAVPLILGTIGFMSIGEPFNDALFTAVTLYAMGYGDGGNVLLVEVARWTAPLATASGLLLILSQIRQRLHNYILYRKGLAVAVFGGNDDAAELLRQLDDRGIAVDDGFVRAQKYILAGDEQDNLAFYHQNRTQLEDCSVYLKCHSLPAQASSPVNLRLYSPEETAARLFWKRSDILALSRTHDHRMDIVLLGFGQLGKHLLTTALQQNIFHPEQQISYHIFGDDEGYGATHPQLSEISDPVVFYACPWYDRLPLLDSAAMVIVAEQNGQTALVEQVLLASKCNKLTVFADDYCGLDILDEQSRLELFRWKQEAASIEQIFNSKLYEDAMQLNLAYAVRYSENPGTAEEEWAALNGFTRYSNISSADYFKVLCKILTAENLPLCFDALTAEQIELLAHLEHIRWCRYHYLNNWTYGIPANGKAKDAAKRIHQSLIPYPDLSEGEKQKDRDNIRLMFELNEQQ